MFLLVGGNWTNGSIAGVFNRNWNNYRSNTNNPVGFRGAFSDSGFYPEILLIGNTGTKGSIFSCLENHLDEICKMLAFEYRQRKSANV